MIYAVCRYLCPLLALFVLGPIAGYMTASLRGPDGGTEASLFLSSAPMSGALAGGLAILMATAIGVLTTWTVGSRMGLFSAGLVLVWAAWGTGRVDLILERTTTGGGGTPLRMLAVEGLLVGVMGVLSALAIMFTPTIKSALPEVRDPAHQHHHLPHEPRVLWESTMPIALAAACAAAGVAVWLLAQETHKGQTFAAAVVAGVFAAAAGRVASPRASAVAFVLAIGVMMAASPLAASIIHGTPEKAVRAAQAGRLFALARPLALDWLAGAFVGIPMGLAWAGSMIERHTPVAGTQRT